MNQRKPCGFTGDGDIWQEINPHYRLQQKRNHSTGLIKTEKGFPGDRKPFFHGLTPILTPKEKAGKYCRRNNH